MATGFFEHNLSPINDDIAWHLKEVLGEPVFPNHDRVLRVSNIFDINALVDTHRENLLNICYEYPISQIPIYVNEDNEFLLLTVLNYRERQEMHISYTPEPYGHIPDALANQLENLGMQAFNYSGFEWVNEVSISALLQSLLILSASDRSFKVASINDYLFALLCIQGSLRIWNIVKTMTSSDQPIQYQRAQILGDLGIELTGSATLMGMLKEPTLIRYQDGEEYVSIFVRDEQNQCWETRFFATGDMVSLVLNTPAEA